LAYKTKGEEVLAGSIISFGAVDSDTFSLDANFANGKTSLRYETSGNEEVLRIEMTHSFGEVDLGRSDDPVRFLTGMLAQNVPSFRNSGACLGLRFASPRPIIGLSSTHQFLTTMTDKEIAEIMSIAIFDLKMGNAF